MRACAARRALRQYPHLYLALGPHPGPRLNMLMGEGGVQLARCCAATELFTLDFAKGDGHPLDVFLV